jgi:hypothetical protein
MLRQSSIELQRHEQRSGGRARLHLSKKRRRAYLAAQSQFNRRRRKLRVGFARLLDLFASGVSKAEIARCAGLSRTRPTDRIAGLLPLPALKAGRPRRPMSGL